MHPGESFLGWGVDEHDVRAQVVPASFEQHRCVDDQGKAGARQPSCDPLYYPLADSRIHNFAQGFQLSGVGKYPLAQSVSTYLAGRQKNAIAPSAPNRYANLLVFQHSMA